MDDIGLTSRGVSVFTKCGEEWEITTVGEEGQDIGGQSTRTVDIFAPFLERFLLRPRAST